MHAWRGHAYGPPESLTWEELPDPALEAGQVRIEVKASAVNFPDILYIAGQYQVKPTPPFTPGFEVAGVIVESRVAALPVGTRVSSGLDGSGGYATHAIAAPHNTFAIPDAMSFHDAASLTVTYQTSHFALHRRARIQPGEWLLVHAGAGGVGSAAIQLGKAAGAKVIATAGGERKVALCRTLGADVAIDYKATDFVAHVNAATAGRGADVICDPVGGDVFDRSTKCIAFEGRIVIVGFTSGRIAQARTNHILLKNYAVLGLAWPMYAIVDPAALNHVRSEILRLYEAGAVKPLLDEPMPLRDAPRAMARVGARESVGKVVLVP
jgi:NADPH:quinone reductase